MTRNIDFLEQNFNGKTTLVLFETLDDMKQSITLTPEELERLYLFYLQGKYR